MLLSSKKYIKILTDSVYYIILGCIFNTLYTAFSIERKDKRRDASKGMDVTDEESQNGSLGVLKGRMEPEEIPYGSVVKVSGLLPLGDSLKIEK
jgi:hypothetical protein